MIRPLTPLGSDIVPQEKTGTRPKRTLKPAALDADDQELRSVLGYYFAVANSGARGHAANVRSAERHVRKTS
jgi:hypothetical protein